jgi:hypothetical protein
MTDLSLQSRFDSSLLWSSTAATINRIMHSKLNGFIVRSLIKLPHSIPLLKYAKTDDKRPLLHTPALERFLLSPS